MKCVLPAKYVFLEYRVSRGLREQLCKNTKKCLFSGDSHEIQTASIPHL